MTFRSLQTRPKATDPQLAHLRGAALETFQASSAVLYWITREDRMVVADAFGPLIRYFHRYTQDMKAYDPLNVERLVSSGKRVATMGNDFHLAPVSEFERYSGYMSDSGFRDVLDFVFWRDGEPFAGLGILKAPEDPPITSETLRIASSMQPYMEFNLAHHPRQREHQRHGRLRKLYGLTSREVEIADLIAGGLTNQDIAENLGIGVGTVKTHVLRMFQKLEVTNRTMLTIRIASLESEIEVTKGV